MRRYPLLILVVVVTVTMSLPAWSASLDDARRMYEGGEIQEALAAIESVLSSDAAEAEKAAALDLLGSIAVDEGQMTMAKHAWSRLVDEYPEYAKSHDTATKLSLVSALLKTEPAPTIAEPAEEPAEEPVEPAAPAALVPPAAAEPSALTEEAAPAPPAAPSKTSDSVLVAARGRPHDAVQELSDRVVKYLREKGVDAASATGGIPVVSDSKMVMPLLLQKGQAESAASVLLLTADFVSMQKVALDCYDTNGAKLWKLKVSGGTGWKGRPYSVSGITEGLAERFMEKLDKKIGQPGLSVSLQ